MTVHDSFKMKMMENIAIGKIGYTLGLFSPLNNSREFPRISRSWGQGFSLIFFNASFFLHTFVGKGHVQNWSIFRAVTNC